VLQPYKFVGKEGVRHGDGDGGDEGDEDG